MRVWGNESTGHTDPKLSESWKRRWTNTFPHKNSDRKCVCVCYTSFAEPKSPRKVGGDGLKKHHLFFARGFIQVLSRPLWEGEGGVRRAGRAGRVKRSMMRWEGGKGEEVDDEMGGREG
jgi:hypothetical protein